MPVTSEIVYRLNARDEIAFVSDSWDRFAMANAGEASRASRVMGKSLWGFIVDATTRELYHLLLTRIRAGGAIRFRFRCDSPSRRRLLEMSVRLDQDGNAEFRSRTISEEERPAQALLAQVADPEGATVRMCGWCKRVEIDDQWVEVEEAVAGLGLLEQDPPPAITHGICEPCYNRMIEALAVA